MEQKLFQAAVGLTWLALPLTLLNYWRAWDQLPPRVAVHFDINWQPNGYTSRQGSLMLALGTTAFLLLIFTIACYATRNAAVSSLAKWSMVAVFYVVLGFVYYVNNWIVDRNLSRQQRTELVVPCDLDAGGGFPQGLKPEVIWALRGAEAPLFHGSASVL
ncbi:MAG: DUF1648 domain-containing protein [Candidatus Sulfotelmatobacter sp.]|jgi:hypothetical protein